MSRAVPAGILTYTLLGTSALDNLQVTIVKPDGSTLVVPKSATQKQVLLGVYNTDGFVSVTLNNLTSGQNYSDTSANCRVSPVTQGWQFAFEDTVGGDNDFNDMIIEVKIAPWTLEFELATQDIQGQRNMSIWDVFCNGTFMGQGSSPNPPRNDIKGTGGTTPGLEYIPRDESADDERLWNLNRIFLSTFDPHADNHIAMGYSTGGDYGHIRRLRVVGSDGTIYYGEYPKGFTYGEAVYNLWRQSALTDTYGVNNSGTGRVLGNLWLCGDGDFPPYQWNMQILDYDEYPVGPDGAQSGLAHFYFTIPTYGLQPPLRQVQRDDPLGGGAPRVAGFGPTSHQYSVRQGWSNTYV